MGQDLAQEHYPLRHGKINHRDLIRGSVDRRTRTPLHSARAFEEVCVDLREREQFLAVAETCSFRRDHPLVDRMFFVSPLPFRHTMIQSVGLKFNILHFLAHKFGCPLRHPNTILFSKNELAR